MKKLLFLLATILLTSFSHAQIKNSLLWEVSGNDLRGKSYIYGTYHTSDEEAFFLMDTIHTLMRRCTIMTGEINMEEERNLDPNMLMERMRMDSLSISDLYSEEDYIYVNQRLQDELGAVAFMTAKFKPFYISIFLAEDLSMEGLLNRQIVLDDSLQVFARNENIEVHGLETATEALDLIDKISLKEQANMLLQSLKDMEAMGIDEMEDRLKVLYLEQNLSGMLALFNEQDLGFDFEKFLVEQRNNYFVIRALEHMRKTSTFCAVGALHLPGKSGLITQMRELGYTVKPIFYNPSGN